MCVQVIANRGDRDGAQKIIDENTRNMNTNLYKNTLGTIDGRTFGVLFTRWAFKTTITCCVWE